MGKALISKGWSMEGKGKAKPWSFPQILKVKEKLFPLVFREQNKKYAREAPSRFSFKGGLSSFKEETIR